MKDNSALEQQVIALLRSRRPTFPDEIGQHTSLEALGIDSLEALELLFEFEETFDLQVPDKVARELHSVGEIIDALSTLLAARGAT